MKRRADTVYIQAKAKEIPLWDDPAWSGKYRVYPIEMYFVSTKSVEEAQDLFVQQVDAFASACKLTRLYVTYRGDTLENTVQQDGDKPFYYGIFSASGVDAEGQIFMKTGPGQWQQYKPK